MKVLSPIALAAIVASLAAAGCSAQNLLTDDILSMVDGGREPASREQQISNAKEILDKIARMYSATNE